MWSTSIRWLFLFLTVVKAAQVLDEYIRHYETLTYDTETVHAHHLRARRSTNDAYVHIEFQAHGRKFNLRLRQDTQTLHPDFELVDESDKPVHFDKSILYEGSLWGEPDTLVFGSIVGGVFAGKIITPKETYYVERAIYHFKGPVKFHSIIYADHDVDPDPFRHKREAQESAGVCGSKSSVTRRFLEENSHPIVEENDVKREAREEPVVKRNVGENIYTENLNRNKRATVSDKKTCPLYIQTDATFWEYFQNELGTNNEERIREEISSLLASHVREVRTIYENSDFRFRDSNGDLFDYRGITFTVHRIKINSTAACTGAAEATNPFCKQNVDVTNFLNLNAYQNHNDYCLAYIFTYRDFAGGTLGLAWVGNSGSNAGGICETYKAFKEGGATVQKSLNTGIVSILNYGKRVAPKVSYLTMAHEIGHNFGSSHDESSQCQPFTSNSDPNGNYIMFASATSGDRANNRKFSPCSVGNMTKVIHAVMQKQQGKANCFKTREAAFCGNGIVESGEECDCGYHGDCTDKCCVARDTPNTNLDQQCKRTASAQCSPSEGPCCSEACRYVNATSKTLCLKDAGCNDQSFCGGGSAACPTPAAKPNGTSCNDNTQTCFGGSCQGSICSRIDHTEGAIWEECFLTTAEMKANNAQFDAGDLCFVSCKKKGNSSKCWSSQRVKDTDFPAEFKTMLAINAGESIPLPPGAPCDNFQGYCDVFSKCRGVDADGPLARLKNLLFSPDTLDTIKTWVTEYWWAVVLIIIGFILLMALFIKVCAVHTPSSNPNKKPARKVSIPHRHQRAPAGGGAARGPPPDYYPQAARGAPPPGRGQPRGGRRPDKIEMKQRRV